MDAARRRRALPLDPAQRTLMKPTTTVTLDLAEATLLAELLAYTSFPFRFAAGSGRTVYATPADSRLPDARRLKVNLRNLQTKINDAALRRQENSLQQ